MAICVGCGAELAGRRQKCDGCKSKSGKQQPAAPAVPDERGEPIETSADGAVSAASARPPVPEGLRRRGQQLWKSIGHDLDTQAGQLALEACRAADRLEELDRIIAGKGVLQLMQFRLDSVDLDARGDEHLHIHIGFQSVLTEARLQQAGFKELLKGLRVLVADSTPTAPPVAAPAAAAPPAANGLDELMKRRERREQATSG